MGGLIRYGILLLIPGLASKKAALDASVPACGDHLTCDLDQMLLCGA